MTDIENAMHESIADAFEVVELACGLTLFPEALARHRARCAECKAHEAPHTVV